MIVCFCINNLGSFGLGAVLTSLIQNCSNASEIEFIFFCAYVDDDVKESIQQLLDDNSFYGKHRFIDFDPETIFKNYRSLQGDYTTYGRLLIPDILSNEQILYLDSDLIIETDILKLKSLNLETKILGAVNGCNMEFSLEKNFYINILHLSKQTISFNAGVLLINSTNWNKNLIKEKLFAVADKYPNELLSADQTVLNAFFAGDFFHLDQKYNVPWYAVKKPNVSTDAIFHFVGSPKPWDYFGKYTHSGYKKWKQYNPTSWNTNVLNKYKTDQIKRVWTIRRSYLKAVLKK